MKISKILYSAKGDNKIAESQNMRIRRNEMNVTDEISMELVLTGAFKLLYVYIDFNRSNRKYFENI